MMSEKRISGCAISGVPHPELALTEGRSNRNDIFQTSTSAIINGTHIPTLMLIFGQMALYE
jgi:hypothetical protein